MQTCNHVSVNLWQVSYMNNHHYDSFIWNTGLLLAHWFATYPSGLWMARTWCLDMWGFQMTILSIRLPSYMLSALTWKHQLSCLYLSGIGQHHRENDTRLESLAILVSIIPEQCCGPSQLCINNSSDDNLLHYHLHFNNHFPSKPGFVWCFSFTCFQTRTSGIVIREFSKGCMPFVSSRIV